MNTDSKNLQGRALSVVVSLTLLLGVVQAWIVVQQGRASRERSEEMAAEIVKLQQSVQRALGQVVMTEAPPELANAVAEAISRWMPAAAVPIPSDSTELREEIASLEESMATGLGSAFASRIACLSWWADVIDMHHMPAQAERSAIDHDQARRLRIGTPSAAPQWCFEIIDAAERRLRDGALREGSDPARLHSIEQVEQALAALEESWPAGDAPAWVAERKESLRKARDAKVDGEIGVLLDQLVAARAAASARTSQPRLRLQVLGGFDGQLLAVLGSLSDANGARRGEIESLLASWQLETSKLGQRIAQDEQVAYQAWALSQMEELRKQSEIECGGANEDEDCQLRLMIKYLVPIDTGLLLPLVLEKFNDEWNYWQEQYRSTLSDDSARDKELLDAVAETRKKGLGEV